MYSGNVTATTVTIFWTRIVFESYVLLHGKAHGTTSRPIKKEMDHGLYKMLYKPLAKVMGKCIFDPHIAVTP